VTAVERRSLGRSGVEVSALGFGAGGFWGLPAFPERAARTLIDVALEEGITVFDTGPNYSNGGAEERLGRTLGPHVDDVFIATKVGTTYENGRHIKDYSAVGMRRSFDESLRRLRRSHVDLLQLHGTPDPMPSEVVDYLLDEKERGRARLIGASTTVPGGHAALTTRRFDALMVEYNVIRRHTEEQLLAACGRDGVGVIVRSPLAQTLYSNRIFRVRSPADVWYLARALKNHREKLKEGRKYRFIAAESSGHDVALQFVLANPNVSTAIIGTTKPDHLRSNVAAARAPLSDVMQERIRSV
jgi:1-deoxyxylulose-5-phosphate synthase